MPRLNPAPSRPAVSQGQDMLRAFLSKDSSTAQLAGLQRIKSLLSMLRQGKARALHPGPCFSHRPHSRSDGSRSTRSCMHSYMLANMHGKQNASAIRAGPCFALHG